MRDQAFLKIIPVREEICFENSRAPVRCDNVPNWIALGNVNNRKLRQR